MKPTKTRLYARVSHEEQKKFGFSIENQLDKLRTYAEENNMLIIDEYIDEGYSAGTTKRPELQRMLSEVQRNEIIIFTRLDRFSRNVLDANEMVKMFIQKNVSIKAIEEDDIDTSTADGMFMFNLKVSLAQRELAKGSERINTVFEYKVKKGQPITGNMPYGYTIEEHEDGTKKVVKDKEVQHIVEDMFDHFLKYHSIRKTMNYINDKYGLERKYAGMNKIFRTEMYCGKFRDNDNYCDPYISPETFEKIRDIVKTNIRERKTQHIYLFTGLTRCYVCGGTMVGCCRIKPDKSYYYYRCNKRSQSCACSNANYVSEIMLENYLLQNLDRLIDDYIVDASIKLDKAPKPQIDIKAITDEMDRLKKMFRKGHMEEKEYDYEYGLLEEKLTEAEKELPEETDISNLEAFVNSGWKEVYQSLKKEDKRALFRSIIKEIRFDADNNIFVDFL